MIEAQVIRTGTQATVILGDMLVASEVSALKREMKQLIGDGVTSLLLDCIQLVNMDSTGIGCVVAAHNSFTRVNGSFSLIHVSSDIYELLCSMRLNRHIKIAPLAVSQE